jgi:hypothetical protein
MEIVKEFEFSGRGHGKYSKLFDEFLALDEGTIVKFTKGTDFDAEPPKFAIALRTGLYNRGFKTKIKIEEDAVVAKVTGKTKAVESTDAADSK